MPQLSIHGKRRLSDSQGIDLAERKRQAKRHAPKYHGLDDLPEELILLIIENIQDDFVRSYHTLNYFATLQNLCLTNRKFNRLVKSYTHNVLDNAHRDPVRVLSSLIQQPDLADGIRYIIFRDSTREERDPQTAFTLSITEQNELARKLGQLGIPEIAGDLRQGFACTTMADCLATALLLARNVEFLEVWDANSDILTAEGVWQTPTWVHLLATAALSRPTGLNQHFRFLRHIRIEMATMDLEQIAPLLLLPSLRIFHLENVEHSGKITPKIWKRDIGTNKSNVEMLIIERSMISSEAIVQVLSAIKALRVLKLEYNMLIMAGQLPGYADPPEWQWSMLNTAILRHKESLERLYMVHSEEMILDSDRETYHLREEPGMNMDNIGSLSSLKDLRYIDTGLRPFQRSLSDANLHDMLPASLEHLVIQVEELHDTSAVELFESTLLALVANCKTKLPQLQDIVVWLPADRAQLWRPTDEDSKHILGLNLASCKAALEGVGISLIVMARLEGKWGPHPSTISETLSSKSPDWGCRVVGRGDCLDEETQSFYRIPYRFHEACNAYHHPEGWSVIDDFERCRR